MNFLDGIGFFLEWAFLTFAGSYQQEPAVFWKFVLTIMAVATALSKLGDIIALTKTTNTR